MSSRLFIAALLLVLYLRPHQILAETVGDIAQLTDDQKFDDKMNLLLRDQAAAGQVFNPADLSNVLNLAPSRTLNLPPAQKTVLEDGELYSRAAKATLAFFCNSASGATALRGSRLGAAVIVDPSGIAVTCFHGIRSNEPFVMIACTADGRPIKVKSIISVFPRQDLALVQLEGEGFDSMPLRSDAPAGTQVRVLGHPLSLHFFMTQGMLSRNEMLPSEGAEKSARPRLNLSVQTVEGFSGGPVLDACGNVLGIQDSRRTVQRGNDTYVFASAIPTGMVLKCLKGDYTESLSATEKLALLDPDQAIVITSANSHGRVVAELIGPKTKLRVFDAAGNVIAEGTPGDEFRSKLPEWAQSVYDTNMKSVDESRKK